MVRLSLREAKERRSARAQATAANCLANFFYRLGIGPLTSVDASSNDAVNLKLPRIRSLPQAIRECQMVLTRCFASKLFLVDHRGF